MWTPVVRLVLACSIVLSTYTDGEADIVISMSFAGSSIVNNSSIFEGTEEIDVLLHFDAIDGPMGNDAGAVFDGFTYVIEATNSGTATAEFFKPITSANLNPLLRSQNWNVADASGMGAPNQLAGNANAPGGSGLNSAFGGFILRVSLDTSELVAGDVITFDPNLNDLVSVSDGGNDFGGSSNYVINQAFLTVSSAVPEPSGLTLVVLMGLIGTGCRSRRRV